MFCCLLFQKQIGSQLHQDDAAINPGLDCPKILADVNTHTHSVASASTTSPEVEASSTECPIQQSAASFIDISDTSSKCGEVALPKNVVPGVIPQKNPSTNPTKHFTVPHNTGEACVTPTKSRPIVIVDDLDDIDLFSKHVASELRALPSQRDRVILKQSINDAIYTFHMQSYSYSDNYLRDSGASVGTSYESYESFNPSSITAFQPIQNAMRSDVGLITQSAVPDQPKYDPQSWQRPKVCHNQNVIDLQSPTPVSISSTDSLGQVEDLIGFDAADVSQTQDPPKIPDPARPRITHMELRSKNIDKKQKKDILKSPKM